MKSSDYAAAHLRPVLANVAFMHGLDFPDAVLDRALDEESRNILMGRPTYPPMAPQHLDTALRGMLYRAQALNPGMHGWFKKLTGIKTPSAIKKVGDTAKKVAAKIDDTFLHPYIKMSTNVVTLGISGRFDKAAKYKKEAEAAEKRYNAVKGIPGKEAEAEHLYSVWQNALALYKKNIKGAQANVIKTGGIAATVLTAGAALASSGLVGGAQQIAVNKLKEETLGKAVEAGVKGALKGDTKALKAAQTALASPESVATAPAPKRASLPFIPLGLLASLLLG